jgi:toxin YoeB
MKLAWTDDGWDDYVYWQTEDKRTLKKINSLIKSINRDGPLKGEGHPEPLKYRPGYSRTINEKDRLVYDIEDGELVIFSCRSHYEDK